MELAWLPVHNRSDGIISLSKILELGWEKQKDMLELTKRRFAEEEQVTKKTVFSFLGSIYGPLAYYHRLLPRNSTYTERRVTRRNVNWNAEISDPLKRVDQVDEIVKA